MTYHQLDLGITSFNCISGLFVKDNVKNLDDEMVLKRITEAMM